MRGPKGPPAVSGSGLIFFSGEPTHSVERARTNTHTHTPPWNPRCATTKQFVHTKSLLFLPPLGKVSPPIQEASARGQAGGGKRRSRLRHCGSTVSPGLPALLPLLPLPRRHARPGARSPGRQRRPAAPTCGTRAAREGSGPEPAPTLASFGRPRTASPWSGGRGPEEHSAQERGGKGHAARQESPAGSQRARPPPSHPSRKAKSPRRARRARGRRPRPGRGLLEGGLGTARSPAGRSTPHPPGAGPSAAATRRATLRTRGHRGRYYLEGSALLV